MPSSPVRVAVIGAGVSGLTTLRHLVSEPELFSPVAYELHETIGGIWRYTDDTGVDCRGYPAHSNTYESMVCNLPKEVMSADDCAMDPDLPSFLNRQQFYEYLLGYVTKFQLSQYIKLNTRVVRVAPVQSGGSTQWEVTTETSDFNVKEKDLKTETYDNVIVCNGNFNLPRMPSEPDLSAFTGRVSHSGTYRRPEVYSGERVLVIGGSFSGSEISHLISPKAKQVYHCHHNMAFPGTDKMADNLERIPNTEIKQAKGSTVTLKNGRELEVDVILYCTGYKHNFPFLADECQLKIEDNGLRASPLYKYIFHADFPTLAFIGIRPVTALIAFALTYKQIKYYVEVCKGNISLPDRDAMEKDVVEKYNNFIPAGLTLHQMLTWLINDEVSYAADLASEGKFDPYPEFLPKLYHYMIFLFQNNHEYYDWFRRHQFKITQDRKNFTVTMTSS